MHKPRSMLADSQRQGFCHVSQLLELLFLKYGIDCSRLHDSSSALPAMVSGSILQPAVQPESEVHLACTPAMANQRHRQTTFSWFRPAELTV